MLVCYMYELHLTLNKESIHLTHFSPVLPLPLDYLNKIFSNSLIFHAICYNCEIRAIISALKKLWVQDSKYKKTYIYITSRYVFIPCASRF